MNLAFCINRMALPGLGATLSSLVRNCSDSKKLIAWFFCRGISDKNKNRLEQLLKSEEFLGGYRFIDFDPFSIFGSLPSLHGDWTTYGRLLLADYINEDRVLYLDADLIIERDILELGNFDLNHYVLAAVGGGRFKYALGNKFYINVLGLHSDLEYFNAGVLLLNLDEWRQKNVKEQCFRIGKQNSLDLPSHDQSLLNIYCAGNFAKLPSSFNCEWLADKPKPQVANKMILHFVGSPKPWDPFGFLIHNGYKTWLKYVDEEWASTFVKITPAYFERIWKIRHSYARSLRNKIIN